MVKTKMKIIVSVVIGIILLVSAFTIYNYAGKKPFAKISREDIAEIHLLFGAYEPYELTEEEIGEIMKLLRDIIIYQRDDSYTEYSGGSSYEFCVKKINGKEIYLKDANPFFIINGRGYRTEYKPCDRFGNFAQKIIEEKIRKNDTTFLERM